MHLPRFMLAAPCSGSGKTLLTCGILQALKNRKMKISSFKCGPDYIDPMFHTRVIGTPSRNLDTYFADAATVRYLFTRAAEQADCSVMEGVMGYYDGLAGISTAASSYDLASVTETPVILVVNARGMSLSLIAHIKGFLEYRQDSHIRGVILNQAGPSIFPELKRMIERELPVRVYGYVPKVEDCVIESRHLGLVTPDEIGDLRQRLQKLAGILEQTLDLEGILQLAETAPDPAGEEPVVPERVAALLQEAEALPPVRIAVARDEAFCFYYQDNLDLLEQLGAELISFSPLHDRQLPAADGLLIGGGYPELYAGRLCGNQEMLTGIRNAIRAGMPCLAECGGFMYLHESMEDMEGNSRPAVGIVPGHAYRTEKLGRFGYIQLTAGRDSVFGPAGSSIRGHEFHYFDSTCNGEAFHAVKPLRKRNWDCMLTDDRSAAGFPHLYYYSNPEFPRNFLQVCRTYRQNSEN